MAADLTIDVNSSGDIQVTAPKGDKGDKGDPGPQGIQGPPGAGGSPNHEYFRYAAAALEPDAIEAVQRNVFSYVVGADETKLLIASWQTQLGGVGRMDVRNPLKPFPLRNCTLTGTGTGSTAILINPGLVSYDNAWDTYYSRLKQIDELPTKNIGFTGVNQNKPFLPGAYGAIVTQYTLHDMCWLSLRTHGMAATGYNLWDEISDTNIWRLGDGLALPVSKWSVTEAHSGSANNGPNPPAGSISYVLLPADWSAVADPNAYVFRDDFMGLALDTNVWTRAQNTAGNVEISATYQWLKLIGNQNWGSNGLYRSAVNPRSDGRRLIVDYYAPQDVSANGGAILGWNDGVWHSYLNFAHGVLFAAAGRIKVYENGTLRGDVGGYTVGAVYRLRITLTATGAVYEIQGGPEYAQINSNNWTMLNPATSLSGTALVTPGASAYAGTNYVSDFRVI